MLKPYHRAITTQALADRFSQAALKTIISANLGQDHWLRGQIGHDEYHFDQNAFERSWAYLERNRSQVQAALEAGEALPAWQAFGRLTHVAQDLYAHSNYVSLWLDRFPEGMRPPPDEIDPFDESILRGPDLRSGKLYYPLEALSFVPLLKKLVIPRLPHDSHAWMNLDSPAQGPRFPYAVAAAVKRTRYEYEQTVRGLPPEALRLFAAGSPESR
jgi:hypothetical protein